MILEIRVKISQYNWVKQEMEYVEIKNKNLECGDFERRLNRSLENKQTEIKLKGSECNATFI